MFEFVEEDKHGGGSLVNKLLHLNRPEKNFQSFVNEIRKSVAGSGKNESNPKFELIPASKTKNLWNKK